MSLILCRKCTGNVGPQTNQETYDYFTKTKTETNK